MTKEKKLKEAAYKAVDYERQLALCGKKEAYNVLQFWMLGATSQAAKEYHEREWIPVSESERRPEKDEKVLVYFDYGDRYSIEIDTIDVSCFITHWQPLPSPPKD